MVAAASENSFTHRVQTDGLGRRGSGRAPASPPFGTLGAGHVGREERVALLTYLARRLMSCRVKGLSRSRGLLRCRERV